MIEAIDTMGAMVGTSAATEVIQSIIVKKIAAGSKGETTSNIRSDRHDVSHGSDGSAVARTPTFFPTGLHMLGH